MKKLNNIILNEYDESTLQSLLKYVINTELDSFSLECKSQKFGFKNEEQIHDADYLTWNCVPTLKDHPYFQAMTLFNELTRAKEDQ